MIKKIIHKSLLLVSIFVFAITSSSSVYAIDEIFTTGNGIFYYNPEDTCVPATSDVSSPTLSSGVTIVQANIKKTANESILNAALEKITAKNPDFISLNEMHSAPRSAITPEGYALYKDPTAVGEEKSTAVLWKKDTWSKVDAGRLLLTRGGPRHTDKGRSASWVVLKNSGGEIAIMISVHLMVNPTYNGPNMLKRQEIYKSSMETLIEKIKELSTQGTVFVAGDFNSRYQDNDDWGPRKILSEISMKSTFDEKGAIPTHKSGGTIDYIFHPNNIKTVSQSTIQPGDLSDHLFLMAELQSTQNSSGNTDTPITGSDNQQKAWNFFTSNGLTPEQAAGIMGNLQAESSFDPKASNNGNYLGIAQWDAGGRWAALKTWANSNSLDPLEFDTQLKYLWKEAGDRKNIEGIKKYADVEHTTWYWGRYFEVAVVDGSNSDTPLTNVQHLDSRTTYAKEFFEKYPKSSTSPGTPTTGSSCGGGNSSLTPGEGNFVDSGEVTGWSSVLENAQLTDSIYGDSLVNKGVCAAITARVFSGNSFGNHHNSKYGTYNAYAVSMWYANQEKGHADRQPKKGSWLFYEHNESSATDAGHIVIYLGDNKILNDGHIMDANVPESTWGLKYLGWIDPTEAGFSAKTLSESDIHGLLDEYK
jgi:endonuclease/exonuclease/phosphatase (EEP) superfamily protein YafD